MFIIGIDPHKGSHTAAVIDRDEQLVGELSVCADRRQRDRLLRWAAPFEPRLWAVEGATGHGALLAQQLVASGETVVDVPAALSARARLLDSGHKDKTDAHDARSAAIVALRNRNLRSGRRSRITGRSCGCWLVVITSSSRLGPGRSVGCMQCCAEMIEGGLSKNLSAKRASVELRKVRPHDAIGIERKRIAVEFLDEVRRIDLALVELHRRIDARREGRTHVGDRGVRRRSDRRVLPDRLQRRRSSVPDRGALRALQRDRTDRSVVGTRRFVTD